MSRYCKILFHDPDAIYELGEDVAGCDDEVFVKRIKPLESGIPSSWYGVYKSEVNEMSQAQAILYLRIELKKAIAAADFAFATQKAIMGAMDTLTGADKNQSHR